MSNPVSKHMGFSGLSNIIVSAGGGGGSGAFGAAGTSGYSKTAKDYKLTAERLIEWQWFQNFMDQNPDIKERFAVHKTYEILNNENTEK